MSQKFLKPIVYSFGLIFLVAAAFAGSYFRLLDNYELNTLDWRFRLRPSIPVSEKIVFIDIDNDTIKKLGHFPLERSNHARLIKALSEFGAKQIVFDIFFSEPRAGDSQLQEAMRSAGNVYLPYVFETGPRAQKGILRASNYSTQNLKDLTIAAKGTGHINVVPDPDGKFRKIPVFIKYREKLYPSLAFLVSCQYLGVRAPDMHLTAGQSVSFGSRLEVPLDEDGNLIVNFTGKWGENYQHYSYGEILQSYEAKSRGEKPVLDLSAFKGKICLIGFTADGTTDLHPSPFEPLYPSVGMHAQVLNSMINKEFIKRAPKTENLFILLILFVLIAWASIKTTPLQAFGILVAGNVILALVSILLFNGQGLWIDVFYPGLLAILVYFICTLIKYILEFKKRVILENELKIAKQIQESFLPSTVPYIEGADIAVTMLTARLVGGDLYDFLKFDDQKIGVMIGDVTGKGVPASLFMAMVSGSFKFYSKPSVAPEVTLASLNEKIMQGSSANLFVTIFYAVFDLKNKSLAYANGGHAPVLYLSKGKNPCFLNVEEGLPLGMIEGSYTGNQVQFYKGDIFVFYTDGITEAVNAASQMYGAERLVALVEANRNLSARRLCAAIKKDVMRFMPEHKQQDDITIVVVTIS